MSSSFSKEMRRATRDVHAVSDALVNAKLLFALSDDSVWCEGLKIFYEIFRFLENAAEENRSGNIGTLLPSDFQRTAAFEKDLDYYLGHDWRTTYIVRDEVTEYLFHLERLCKENPDLLLAYIYHLYMGLLSGGQILKKKRQIKDKLMFKSSADSIVGYAVVTFNDRSISDLKNSMRTAMDAIAETLSEDMKMRLLVESRLVFEWNNKIIKTVDGASKIVWVNFVYFLLFVTTIAILYFVVVGT